MCEQILNNIEQIRDLTTNSLDSSSTPLLLDKEQSIATVTRKTTDINTVTRQTTDIETVTRPTTVHRNFC